MPWIHRCAWHGVALRDDCQHCGLPVAVKADWLAGANLECACSQSPLDTDLIMRAAAPEGAKLFTDNYLHWAAEERRSEERRGGKEWVSTCSFRWVLYT